MPSEPQSLDCWHILAETSVPVAEFGLALSTLGSVTSWVPEMSLVAGMRQRVRSEPTGQNSSLRRMHFPLQRGYTRIPKKVSAGIYRNVFSMLMEQTADPAQSALICTSSFWASTASLWPGPVVYYATDFTVAYAGLSPKHVVASDRMMCSIADLVCPNSVRLASYFTDSAECPQEKIVVLPNATRLANVRDKPGDRPEELPADVRSLPRPVVGVIGDMGDNIDWELVYRSIESAPQYSWLFVGPVSGSLLSRQNDRFRRKVMCSSRAMFIGARPYETLFRYARAVDVAVMPYRCIEPTFSGSSTRFYEHLAAGRPMLATRGVNELLSKEPLLTLVDSAEELALELQKLLSASTSDQYCVLRFQASQPETWEARAGRMRSALMENLHRNETARMTTPLDRHEQCQPSSGC